MAYDESTGPELVLFSRVLLVVSRVLLVVGRVLLVVGRVLLVVSRVLLVVGGGGGGVTSDLNKSYSNSQSGALVL